MNGIAWLQSMRERGLPLLALELPVLVALLALPLVLHGFWIIFATRLVVLSLLALSFDLTWGYAGILSFGQALFFGASGYLTAVLSTRLGIASLLVALPLGTLFGLALAALFCWAVLLGRRPLSLIFVALSTLMMSYAAERLMAGWTRFGAANGIPSIPSPMIFGWEMDPGPEFYYVALAVLLLVYLGFRVLVRSQFGLVLAGARVNEDRIKFFGYHYGVFKAVVFSLGGAVAGMAGSLYAFHEGYVGPSMMGVVLSTQVVLYALFGGVGTLIGAVIGVFGIEYASFTLSESFPGLWPILLGALLLLLVMYRPSGIVGLFVTERRRIGNFGQVPPAATQAEEVKADAAA